MASEAEEERHTAESYQEKPQRPSSSSEKGDPRQKENHEADVFVVALEAVSSPVRSSSPLRISGAYAHELGDGKRQNLLGVERPGTRIGPGCLRARFGGGGRPA